MLTREQTAQALQRLAIDPSAEGYSAEAVHRGANVELEHTADPDLAVQIAIDHLRERPDYYDRLAQAQAAPLGGQRRYINKLMFDPFTIVHASAGLIAGRVGVPWWGALAMSVTWELVEPSLKRSTYWRGYFPEPTHDTWQNHVGDTIGVMGGWYVGAKLVK